MSIKPGYRTSEFWFTLVSFVFSGLYLAGILQENSQKEQLIEVVSHAVESTILISGQVLILYKYIKGRTEVKKVAREINKDSVEKTPEPEQVKPEAKTKPKKKTKTAKKKTK
jgi:hypothetical protein